MCEASECINGQIEESNKQKHKKIEKKEEEKIKMKRTIIGDVRFFPIYPFSLRVRITMSRNFYWIGCLVVSLMFKIFLFAKRERERERDSKQAINVYLPGYVE